MAIVNSLRVLVKEREVKKEREMTEVNRERERGREREKDKERERKRERRERLVAIVSSYRAIAILLQRHEQSELNCIF